MKILIINSSTDQELTQRLEKNARTVASQGTEIATVTPKHGTPSNEGFTDVFIALPGIVEAIKENPGVDAYIISGYEDSGIEHARSTTTKPVITAGEAAFHIASLIAIKFGVVTTFRRTVPLLQQNLAHYGLISRVSKIRALEEIKAENTSDPNVPDRSLLENKESIKKQIQKSIDEDMTEAIALCTPNAFELTKELSEFFGIPVVDGLSSAVKLAEAVAGLKLTTSKAGGYAEPLTKKFLGMTQIMSPSPSECQ